MENLVYSIRKKFNITQEDLAHILGVSFTSVNAWEGGKRAPQEHMRKVLSEILSNDKLPSNTYMDHSIGLRRSDAGFVSSILDYGGKRDAAPYTHKIGRWYGSLPSFLVSDLVRFVQTDMGRNGPLLANFSGSGTVALEAAINGMRSYGIDVNPMAVLLGKLKTKKICYSYENLMEAFELVIKNKLVTVPSLNVGNKNLIWNDNKWMSSEARSAVKRICTGISKIDNVDVQIMLSVALGMIFMNFCNIDKRCTNHYVYKDNGDFDEQKFIDTYRNEVINYYNAVCELNSIDDFYTPNIKLGNVCELPFDNSSMDVVFSHPPYGTTINYYSINRLPISILESISFSEDVGIKDARCQKLDLSSGTLPRFNSFTEQWVNEAYRVLGNDGVFISIIGDSRDKGNLSHPFTDIIAYGENAGFSLKEMFIWVTNHKSGMHVKRKGNHIDHNYVIIMQK